MPELQLSRFLFLQPPKTALNDFEQTTFITQRRAFSIIQTASLDPEWKLTEQFLEVAEADLTKIYVLYAFFGDVFAHLCNLKCRVISPLVILQSHKYKLQYPVRIVPTWAQTLHGQVISGVSFNVDDENEIRDITIRLGGVYKRNIGDETTIAIVGVFNPDDAWFKTAIEMDTPVLQKRWIEKLYESANNLEHQSECLFEPEFIDRYRVPNPKQPDEPMSYVDFNPLTDFPDNPIYGEIREDQPANLPSSMLLQMWDNEGEELHQNHMNVAPVLFDREELHPSSVYENAPLFGQEGSLCNSVNQSKRVHQDTVRDSPRSIHQNNHSRQSRVHNSALLNQSNRVNQDTIQNNSCSTHQNEHSRQSIVQNDAPLSPIVPTPNTTALSAKTQTLRRSAVRHQSQYRTPSNQSIENRPPEPMDFTSPDAQRLDMSPQELGLLDQPQHQTAQNATKVSRQPTEADSVLRPVNNVAHRPSDYLYPHKRSWNLNIRQMGLNKTHFRDTEQDSTGTTFMNEESFEDRLNNAFVKNAHLPADVQPNVAGLSNPDVQPRQQVVNGKIRNSSVIGQKQSGALDFTRPMNRPRIRKIPGTMSRTSNTPSSPHMTSSNQLNNAASGRVTDTLQDTCMPRSNSPGYLSQGPLMLPSNNSSASQKRAIVWEDQSEELSNQAPNLLSRTRDQLENIGANQTAGTTAANDDIFMDTDERLLLEQFFRKK